MTEDAVLFIGSTLDECLAEALAAGWSSDRLSLAYLDARDVVAKVSAKLVDGD